MCRGCDHIHCEYLANTVLDVITVMSAKAVVGTKCNHDFCWLCLADYQNIWKEGNSAHQESCEHWRHNPTVQWSARCRLDVG